MLMTGSAPIDAERAFTQQARARRLAAVVRRLRRESPDTGRLAVYDERQATRSSALPGRGMRDIPLAQITGTLEPSKASLFDRCFRPAGGARARWQRVWIAEHRGQALPPIEVVRVRDGYVLRDGHHRVSVAAARGARTITATIDALAV